MKQTHDFSPKPAADTKTHALFTEYDVKRMIGRNKHGLSFINEANNCLWKLTSRAGAMNGVCFARLVCMYHEKRR